MKGAQATQLDSKQEYGRPKTLNSTSNSTKKSQLICHHTGKWQKFEVKKEKKQPNTFYNEQVPIDSDDEEDYEAWSCCMNQDLDSAGCVKRRSEKDKWNYASFNNN